VLGSPGYARTDAQVVLALEFECIRVHNIRKLPQQAADNVRNLGKTD
jgi:hypothetical protein